MRLLYFAPPESVHTKRWLDYFAARHEVFLAAPDCDVRALAAAVRPDIVHGHSITDWGWRARDSGVHPLVLTAWGNDLLLDTSQPVLKLRAAETLAAADLTTAPSQQLAECAHALGARAVELVRFGADLEIFTPHGDGSEWRTRLGLSASDRIIFSARAFDPLYNIDRIAAAMPAVIKQFPQARFLFTTYQCVTAERRRYRAEIEAMMIAAGVRDRACFVDSAQARELQQLYRLAEIVVSIPSSDGCPVTIFEALACQRPVITGALRAYDGIIESDRTGLRIDVTDAGALAMAICQLLEDPHSAGEMAAAGRAIALEQGDYRREMAKMEALYQRLKN